MKFFIILLIISITSCRSIDKKSSIGPKLNKCDQVEIIYFFHNNNFTYEIKDTNALKVFSDLISFNNDINIDTCKASGKLIYKQRGQKIFETYFSTANSNDSAKCNYAKYSLNSKDYTQKLTYAAGMLIDEILYERFLHSSTKYDSLNIYLDSTKPIKIMEMPENYWNSK